MSDILKRFFRFAIIGNVPTQQNDVRLLSQLSEQSTQLPFSDPWPMQVPTAPILNFLWFAGVERIVSAGIELSVIMPDAHRCLAVRT